MGWVGDVGWVGWTVMAVCMLAFWTVAIYLVATLFRAERTDPADGPARTGHEDDPLWVSTQERGAAPTGEQQGQARG